MTDKEKILKAINQKQQEIWPTDSGEMEPATVPNNLEQGWLNALKWMEDFINSLPDEQPSEDLEKEIESYLTTNRQYAGGDEEDLWGDDCIRDAVKHGANWQKEQLINKACEWLRRCVDVDDKVKMIDGEPEALSFIEKAKHRIEVANQVVEDFKKAMEQ